MNIFRGWKGRPTSETVAPSTEVGPAAGVAARLSQRAFLKVVAATLGGSAAAVLAARAEPAAATYYVEAGGDRVDTNLTVQGNLLVDPSGSGKVGIGISNPASRLDVAGAIAINGAEVIGTDGVVKKSYYAP